MFFLFLFINIAVININLTITWTLCLLRIRSIALTSYVDPRTCYNATLWLVDTPLTEH